MHLTLRQLNYFIRIVDAGNMTRAADLLRVAPTALSLQVKAMEERLGVQLLLRHSRGVRPTPAGLELYGKGQQIIALVDDTERTVSPAPGGEEPMPCLRLGILPSALHAVGVEAAMAGESRRNGFVVQLVEGSSHDLASRLRDGELSFVLAADLKSSDTMNVLDLMEERLVFVTRRRDARADGKVTFADALASDLVFFGEQDSCWKAVHAMARSMGLPVNVAHKVASIDVIRHMVGQGLGTTILPYGLVADEVARGDIAAHVINDRPIRRRLSLGWLPDDRPAVLADAFMRYVGKIVKDLHRRTAPHSRLLLKGRPALRKTPVGPARRGGRLARARVAH